MNTLQKTLNFSESFIKAEYVENVTNFPIDGKTIVINANDTGIVIEGKTLGPWKSSIYSSLIIPRACRLICITLDIDFYSPNSYPHAEILMKKWSHIYEIFSLPHLKQTRLWRSDVEHIDNIGFNLWYAAPCTNCGIHIEHSFRELHTQIYGIGRMQKFRSNNLNSIYQDVFMAPGYTHEPFYNEDSIYPWHQYWADSDCIWLATEFYD